MNWGKWIVLSFLLFAVFIGVLVAICVREEVNLVSGNYYQEELDYQVQIERMQNANALDDQPSISATDQVLEVHFVHFSNIENGEVRLFRPSDAILDRKFILMNSVGDLQRFDISTLSRGLYHAKMKWSMNGKEYFIEKTIVL